MFNNISPCFHIFFPFFQKYGQSVQISSKLVTRITQLPFMANPETIAYQTQQVTTEVFPCEMGEGEIPWWVWLLAALLGLLLLAIITLCLYKVTHSFSYLAGCVIGILKVSQILWII